MVRVAPESRIHLLAVSLSSPTREVTAQWISVSSSSGSESESRIRMTSYSAMATFAFAVECLCEGVRCTRGPRSACSSKTPPQAGRPTAISFANLECFSRLSAFVRVSATCSPVGTYSDSITSSSTLRRRK